MADVLNLFKRWYLRYANHLTGVPRRDGTTRQVKSKGSFSVAEPEKDRGLVITTSESNDLSSKQETEMLDSIIKTNDEITPK